MEYQKITNFLGSIPDKVPKFITKKWVEVYDQSNKIYSTNKQIRFKTPMLQSDLCDYSDEYIGVTDRNKYNRSLVLKNNAPFISCISKITNALIDNAEDLDFVMPIFNLIEYSKNYSKTSATLWNYYKDISIYPITNSESFKYKTCIIGRIANNGNTKEVVFSVSLKHLSNFWRTLDMSLINCEVFLTLTWSQNCVLADMTTRDAEGKNRVIVAPTDATFKITDTKF